MEKRTTPTNHTENMKTLRTHSTLSSIQKPRRGYWLRNDQTGDEIFLGEKKHTAGNAYERLPEKMVKHPTYVMHSDGVDVVTRGNAWASFETEAADLE